MSSNTCSNGRLGGHERRPATPAPTRASSARPRGIRQFYKELERDGHYRSPGRDAPAGVLRCTGPVTYAAEAALTQDVDQSEGGGRRGRGAGGVHSRDLADPAQGQTSSTRPTTSYFAAVGEAMRTEYRMIVDAGFILQIDDPRLPDLRSTAWCRRRASPTTASGRALHVEMVNHALAGIPQDRMRYHICWGSWHGAAYARTCRSSEIVDLILRCGRRAM